MLNIDPPDHTRLRRLVSQAFTARRVAELRPRVQELTDELIDSSPARGEVDLIHEFAFPLPIHGHLRAARRAARRTRTTSAAGRA